MRMSDRIGRRMKLHDLHVFIAVVQAGSMNKAATLLNTGQSAISRSIAELEQTVGVRLVDRSPQGVEPTQYGRALLDGGAAVFDDLRRALKTIEFLADPTAGEVRIGSSALLAASFVSALIDRLSQRYPRIVFHLVTGHVPALHRELTGRNVDLLIVRQFGPIADEQLDFEFLFDDSFVVAAGAQNPWVRRRKIELAELVERIMGAATAGKRDCVGCNGSVSRQRTQLSPHECGNGILRGADQSLGDRALCRNLPSFRIAVFPKALRNKNIARQTANGPAAKRNRNAEEPRARPRRAAFHRLRSRSGQAAGEAKVMVTDVGLWHQAAVRGSATSRQILRVEQTCHGRRGTAESDVVDGARSQQRGAIG